MGAGGHTGSFVVAELRRRGMTPIPCGRATDLDLALRDADAVINCAGPFAATARPVIEAAIRAGIAYLDVTAELEVVTDTFASYAEAGIPIVPAVAFYGGLADLLATAAMGDWPVADHLTIAYALSGWRPTPGARATGRVSAQRRNGRRIAYTSHRLQPRAGDAPRTEWTFPAPIGTRPVVGEFTMADSATIPTHLDTPEISTYMSSNAVDDLHAPDPSGPVAVDERGRSAQTFLVEVVATGRWRGTPRGGQWQGHLCGHGAPGRRGSLSNTGRSGRHRRRRLGRRTLRRNGLPELTQPGTPDPEVTAAGLGSVPNDDPGQCLAHAGQRVDTRTSRAPGTKCGFASVTCVRRLIDDPGARDRLPHRRRAVPDRNVLHAGDSGGHGCGPADARRQVGGA